MLPAELARLLDEYDQDDLNGRIEKATYENDMVSVALNVSPAWEVGKGQRWIVRSEGLLKFRIENTSAVEIEELEDHPFLWPFNEKVAELYIKRRALDPKALYVAITRTHYETLGPSEPLETHLMNNLTNLEERCAWDNGLFAKGPLPLLKVYTAALQEAGCEPYLFGEGEAKRWDGRQWVSTKARAKVLLFGDSWIVADQFHWDQLAPQP